MSLERAIIRNKSKTLTYTFPQGTAISSLFMYLAGKGYSMVKTKDTNPNVLTYDISW